ncbi:MAG: GNAT family N-acetyltransferase [Ignavibacteriales bacterium]|nr:GNAT family N-acetyltransferase [Ignavibacteriales bacterium]
MVEETQNTTVRRETPNIKLIDNIDDLKNWRDDWNNLVLHSATPSLFISYEWLITWWQCHKNDKLKLFVLMVVKNDELIGIAPLMKIRHNIFGFGWNSIEFISMMSHAYSPTNCSGMLDIISTSANSPIVVDAIIEYLKFRNREWSYARLNPIPHDSITISSVANIAGKTFYRYHQRNVFSGATIYIVNSWDQYNKGLMNNLYNNIVSAERKLMKLGEIEIKEMTSSPEFDKWYDDILSIERRSWKWSRGVRINEKVFKNFYKQIAEQASVNGWLRLWFLFLDGKAIAYDFAIDHNNKITGLKSSFDDEYRKYSPGNILKLHSFKKYFEENKSSIDLLWGDLYSKRNWTNHYQQFDEIFIFNDYIFSKILYHLHHTLRIYNLFRYIQRYSYFYSRRIRSFLE